jgi:hypothetical protein
MVQSYDLPDNLDVNTVVHAVELAFTQTLETRPWIVEGSVLSPLPARPASFTVAERRVHFERLGVAIIHEVECPGSLASVQAWVADRAGSLAPHRYTGCIQLYAGAYRVHLIDSKLVLKSSRGVTGSAGSMVQLGPNLLPRVAKAFLEHVTEAREVTDAQTPVSFPSDQQFHEKAPLGLYVSIGEQVTPVSAVPDISAGSSFMPERGQDLLAASPLVCLAPRNESAAVRTQQGAGQVVKVLRQGSMLVVDESVDAAYFPVKTTEGLAGWVSRFDVRRLPCPIG